MNNDNTNKQSQQQQQPTFNLPSYGPSAGTTAEQLKKKEEDPKFSFGFGEKPSVGASSGVAVSGFGAAPAPPPSVTSQSSSLYKPSSTSISSETSKASNHHGHAAPTGTAGGLLSGLPPKAAPATSRVDQPFEKSEGISSISSFFNNNVAPGQTSTGFGGKTTDLIVIISILRLWFGIETKCEFGVWCW